MDMLAPRKPANDLFETMSRHRLCWIAHLGIGYLEVYGEHYDEAYFENYRSLPKPRSACTSTTFAPSLSAPMRRTPCASPDNGIGDGAFLQAFDSSRGMGYDVNPAGVAWLKSREKWGDLYASDWPAATFWDSLEHIRDPSLALAQISHTAFVSIPIFADLSHVLRSKHLKPSEHYWYFTRDGFSEFVKGQGFEVLFWTNRESLIGREDIETFVLRRRRA